MSTVAASTLTHTFATAQRQKRAAGSVIEAGPVAPELNVGLAFAPGTRVLDLVSGEEGVIIAGQISHTLIQPSKPGAPTGTPGQAG